MQNDIDTLRMVRDDIHSIARSLDSASFDLNSGYVADKGEELFAIAKRLDALIARLSSEKLASERSEQARLEKEIDDATPKNALGFRIPKTLDDIRHNDTIRARMEQNTGGDETSAVKAIQDWGSDNGYTFVHSEACDLLNRIRAHFNAAAKDIK